jgi:hypothetical protein
MNPEIYLTLEIGSNEKKIDGILDLLPRKDRKYYNIGEIRKKDNKVYECSYYCHKYSNGLMDADYLIQEFLRCISIDILKKITKSGFKVILVYHIIYDGNLDDNDLYFPEAGLSSMVMELLGKNRIDYQIHLCI